MKKIKIWFGCQDHKQFNYKLKDITYEAITKIRDTKCPQCNKTYSFNIEEDNILVVSGWLDGTCTLCESPILECGCDLNDKIPETYSSDYQNMCSNPNCKEHKWHYIGDQDQLDYYEHI